MTVRRALLIASLFSMPVACHAVVVSSVSVKAIINPYTSRPDFVTVIDTNSVQAGSNVTIVATSTGISISATGGGGGAATLPLPPGDTNYVQNRNTLQSGSTFYTSSGTVDGQFTVNSVPSVSAGHEFSNLTFLPSNSTFGNVHSVTFKRFGSVTPAQLIFYSYGSDSSKYSFWDMAVPGQNSSLEIGDQGSTYIKSGVGSGNGETIVLSSATGISALPNNSALGAYGASSLNKPIFGAYSADGAAGTTLRFLVDHSSVTVKVPVVDSGGTAGNSGQVYTSNGNGSAPTWQTAAAGGGGGASTLGVTTGTSSGYTAVISSPTNSIIFDVATTNGQLLTGTSYFFSLKSSSVTLQGPLSVTSPLTLAAGVFGATAISLSTGVTGSLPAASIAAGLLGTSVVASSIALNTPLMQNTLQAGTSIYPAFIYAGSSGSVSGAFKADGIITASATAITTAAGLIANAAVDKSSITAQGIFTAAPPITLTGNGFGNIIGVGNNLPSGGTNYVQNQSAPVLQGATFYVSSGTAQRFNAVQATFTSTTNGVTLSLVNSTGSIAATFDTTAAGTGNIFVVQDSTGRNLVAIDGTGHIVVASTQPVLSACGTSPTLATNSSDSAGTVTVGSTASGCTVTFGNTFTNTPTCVVSEQTMSLTNSLAYTVSTSALTLTETTFGGVKFDYVCIGH